jgi:tripartite-type tricarboxylate transporter receptor subunit TctC
MDRRRFRRNAGVATLTVAYGGSQMTRISPIAAVISVLMIALGCLLTSLSTAKEPDKFPSHPLNFICPLPAGSTADIGVRHICKAAERWLGQPVVVVNKPGAGNTIGTAAIATAKPDGYTVGYPAPTAMLVTPFVEKLPYHPIKDFQQIMQYTESTFAVSVKGDSPFKTFKDLIAFAAKNPKKLTYGTTGAYGITHLTMLQVSRKDNLQFGHVPFKGGPEVLAALLGAHIDFGVGDFTIPLLESGEVRLLALLSERRNKNYPDVPALSELGYDRPAVYPAPTYMNVAGPRGVPEDIVKKLEQAFTQAMKETTFIRGMQELRFPVIHRDSKEMTEYMAYYYEFYGNLMKDMGLRKQ